MPRQFVPSPRRSKRVTVIIIFLAIGLLFVIPAARNGMRSAFRLVGIGVLRGSNAAGGAASALATELRPKRGVVKENDALRARLEEQEAKMLEAEALFLENAELKAALGRTDGKKFTLASVLSKPPYSLYDTILIDGGAAAGMQIGKVVFAHGQTPIGTVEAVNPYSALVRLFSSPAQKTEARIWGGETENPKNLDVTLVGRGGGNFSATLSRDFPVTANTVVRTKELTAHSIALYKKVISDPRDPVLTILLVSPVNVQELAFVEVEQ